MRRDEFLPYQCFPEYGQLDLKESEGIEEVGQSEWLWQSQVDKATLRIRYKCDWGRVVSAAFPEDERDSPPIAASLILSSVSSRIRTAYPLKEVSEGEWGLTKELDRQEFRGFIEATVALWRNNTRAELPTRYGAFYGSRIVWSSPIGIWIDEREIPPGKALVVEWCSFSQAGFSSLREQAAHSLYAVHKREAVPIILLNSDIPNLQDILESRGHSGARAAARDAVFSQIAYQVWSSLLSEILASAQAIQDNEGVIELEALQDWEQSALTSWLPWFYGTDDESEGMQALAYDFQSGNWAEVIIQRRLPAAIQRRFHAHKMFGKLVKEVARNE